MLKVRGRGRQDKVAGSEATCRFGAVGVEELGPNQIVNVVQKITKMVERLLFY